MKDFSWQNLLYELAEIADSSHEFDKDYLPYIKQAIAGPVKSPEGKVRYVSVNMYCVHQTNVDTEECFSIKDTEVNEYPDMSLPLSALSNKEVFDTGQKYWEQQDAIAWVSFLWRIYNPITNRLSCLDNLK